MNVTMSDHVEGALIPLAILGGIAALIMLLWLGSNFLPEVVWATVKRLPLHNPDRIDRAAAVIAAANRSYILRIPFGVRLVLSLGGALADQDRLLEDLRAARRIRAEREVTVDA